ncbi:hypothetical protein DFH09DRAFT_1098608 [Mycena vulgaris]|nr:hypothetical protein DFH09DRAFT_1098608 [Mycena vulgaris]
MASGTSLGASQEREGVSRVRSAGGRKKELADARARERQRKEERNAPKNGAHGWRVKEGERKLRQEKRRLTGTRRQMSVSGAREIARGPRCRRTPLRAATAARDEAPPASRDLGGGGNGYMGRRKMVYERGLSGDRIMLFKKELGAPVLEEASRKDAAGLGSLDGPVAEIRPAEGEVVAAAEGGVMRALGERSPTSLVFQARQSAWPGRTAQMSAPRPTPKRVVLYLK